MVVTFQSGQNVRQFVDILKLNVNNRAHNLRNMAELTGAPLFFLNLFNFGGSGLFFLFQFLNRLGVKFGNTCGLFSAGRFFGAAVFLAGAFAAVFFSVINLSFNHHLKRFGTGDNFYQLGGNCRLANSVIAQG